MTRSHDYACERLILTAGFMLCAALTLPPYAKSENLAPSDEYGTVQRLPVSKTYNLNACFSIADQHNKDIAVARHNLLISRAGIKIAGALPNPQLQVQTGFGDSFEYLFTGQTQQAFLTEQIQTAGKRSKKLAVARQTLKISDTQLSALRFDVHNRVRRAYCELAAAEAYDLLIQRQRQAASELLEIAKARAGSSKDNADVLQAMLNVDQFEPLLNQVQGRLQQASTNLTLLLGEKPERVEIFDVDDTGLFEANKVTNNVPSPERALPALSDLLRLSMTARPDLKMAQERATLSRKSLSLSRAERVPDVFLGSGFTFSTFAKNQPAGLSGASNYFGEGAFFTMSTEAPVFYQHQGEIRQAVSTVRQSDLQVELLKAQTAASIVADYNTIKTSQANLLLLKQKLIPTSDALAKSALEAYRKGTVDLGTAMVAQQQSQQSLSSFFDTIVSYQNAWADLERDVGVPLKI
jgi:cobalt-zinc-cadmium efflux system outer membrane protein